MTHGLGRARGRIIQALRVRRDEGARAVIERVVRRLNKRFGGGESFALQLQDIGDSTKLCLPASSLLLRTASALEIGWILTPPGPGSGGHTTILRMVTALEAAGHRCTLYVFDRYGGDIHQHTKVIRAHWPEVRAGIRDATEGIGDGHGIVATSWPTAHFLASRVHTAGQRFYFVQDYEPYFYARGSEYALAEDSYRFGFHGITAGRWLSSLLGERYGMQCDPFPFGADTSVYQYDNPRPRDGVVFYAKPEVPRRAFVLGALALQEVHKLHPEVILHLFGGAIPQLPFPVVNHGVITPRALNRLYNECFAGLSLSLTNISLIPWELLACGTIPVINDADHNRLVLENPNVTWAPARPRSLASALSSLYVYRSEDRAAAAAVSVQSESWIRAGAVVVEAIERKVRSVDAPQTVKYRV